MSRENGAGEREATWTPELLDVVKIDGRWAQVVGRGDKLTFLSDGTIADVDWSEYVLVKNYKGRAVKLVEEFDGESFTDEEISRIHWEAGHAEDEAKKLAQEVSVFGIFEKK